MMQRLCCRAIFLYVSGEEVVPVCTWRASESGFAWLANDPRRSRLRWSLFSSWLGLDGVSGKILGRSSRDRSNAFGLAQICTCEHLWDANHTVFIFSI